MLAFYFVIKDIAKYQLPPYAYASYGRESPEKVFLCQVKIVLFALLCKFTGNFVVEVLFQKSGA